MASSKTYGFTTDQGERVCYTLGDAIGAGGFGRVYKGCGLTYDGRPAGMYAVKRIALRSTGHSSDPVAQFLDRNWTNLIHLSKQENLVRYYGVHASFSAGDAQPHGHIVMEYCAGQDLSAFLAHAKPELDPSKIVDFTAQMLRGVGHLHSLDVIHGDLKPANVFLVQLSGKTTLKIGDIDDRFQLEGKKPLPKSSHQIQGTASYMSPEMMATRVTVHKNQANVREPCEVTIKTDIWSFGCIVFEMECRYRGIKDKRFSNDDGTKTISFASESATIYNYVVNYNCSPKAPALSSAALKQFLRVCFAREPDMRPSAADLLRHFYISGEKVEDLSQKTPASFRKGMTFVAPIQALESKSIKADQGE